MNMAMSAQPQLPTPYASDLGDWQWSDLLALSPSAWALNRALPAIRQTPSNQWATTIPASVVSPMVDSYVGGSTAPNKKYKETDYAAISRSTEKFYDSGQTCDQLNFIPGAPWVCKNAKYVAIGVGVLLVAPLVIDLVRSLRR